MSKEFAAMEEAALEAYKEDMKRMRAEAGNMTLHFYPIKEIVVRSHFSVAFFVEIFFAPVYLCLHFFCKVKLNFLYLYSVIVEVNFC